MFNKSRKRIEALEATVVSLTSDIAVLTDTTSYIAREVTANEETYTVYLHQMAGRIAKLERPKPRVAAKKAPAKKAGARKKTT